MSREILTHVRCDYCGAEETMVGAVNAFSYPGWGSLHLGDWRPGASIVIVNAPNDICDKCIERIGQKAENEVSR